VLPPVRDGAAPDMACAVEIWAAGASAHARRCTDRTHREGPGEGEARGTEETKK